MKISYGPDWQKDLWASPFRLRFELNDGGVDAEASPTSYIAMFTTSYDRARVLARAALPGDRVIAIIAGNPRPMTGGLGKWRGWTKASAFKQLEGMGQLPGHGFPTKRAVAKWSGQLYPADQIGGDLPPWKHRAVSLTWEQADILLWNDIGQDIGIRPIAPVRTKLVDIERGISVDAYDDRGLDVTALDQQSIAHLYERFSSWLLDFDRPRMALAFSAAT